LEPPFNRAKIYPNQSAPSPPWGVAVVGIEGPGHVDAFASRPGPETAARVHPAMSARPRRDKMNGQSKRERALLLGVTLVSGVFVSAAVALLLHFVL
jgi:hypothetical protein